MKSSVNMAVGWFWPLLKDFTSIQMRVPLIHQVTPGEKLVGGVIPQEQDVEHFECCILHVTKGDRQSCMSLQVYWPPFEQAAHVFSCTTNFSPLSALECVQGNLMEPSKEGQITVSAEIHSQPEVTLGGCPGTETADPFCISGLSGPSMDGTSSEGEAWGPETPNLPGIQACF